MKAMPFIRHSNLFLAALAALVCGGAMAFSALQFDASFSRSVSRTDGCVVAWVSTRGGGIARPCHTNGNGWAAPQYDSRGVVGFSSATGTVSPISFPLSETGLVARAFIVADGAGASFGSTLLDAPCPLRLMQSEEDGAFHFATSSVLSTVGVSIDFTQTTEYTPGPHLYEMELAEPCPLCDLYIGGCPATPAWNRNWNGTVREAIFVSPTATATDAAAIRSFLSKKWEIGRYRSGMSDEPATLRALGIKTGGVYGSMLIMR
jgi:hypothetical protein